jgi:hypothetical protein
MTKAKHAAPLKTVPLAGPKLFFCKNGELPWMHRNGCLLIKIVR